MKFVKFVAIAACFAVSFEAPAQADPAPEERVTMSGDWGGLRSKIHDAGVDVALGYTGEVAGNLTGGERTRITGAGQLSASIQADGERLIGLRGGTFKVSLTYRHGANLVTHAGLDTLLQTQEIYGRGNVLRLSEFWYQQDVGAGIDLKLGRMAVGEDFSSAPCGSMNSSFCGAPVGNIGGDFWYNWPISQWAARARIGSGGWYAGLGAYEMNPRNLETKFFIGHFDGAKGVLVPFETGLHVQLGRMRLPGHYRIGGWYGSFRSEDVLTGANGMPAIDPDATMLEHSGKKGGFLLAEQQISGSAEDDGKNSRRTTHGMTAFFSYTRMDRRTDRIDRQFALGVRYVGLFPRRPKDELQFGYADSHINPRASKLTKLRGEGGNGLRSEHVFELDYVFVPHPWFRIQPTLQLILSPGGDSSAAAILVPGLKSAVVF